MKGILLMLAQNLYFDMASVEKKQFYVQLHLDMSHSYWQETSSSKFTDVLLNIILQLHTKHNSNIYTH